MPHDQQYISAIMSNDYKLLSKLLENRSPRYKSLHDFDDNVDTYFHIAAKRLLTGINPSDLRILELLLEHGISPTIRNMQDKMALELIDINGWDSERQWTPLITAIRFSLPRLFNLLINSPGIDLNKPTDRGMCPLSAVILDDPEPDTEKFLALIDRGANIFVGYRQKLGANNPLGSAMCTYDEHCISNSLSKNMTECVNILLDKYAGIGYSFLPFSLSSVKYDFTGKILLGAEIDAILIKSNPTIAKSIRTVDDFERMLDEKKLNKNIEFDKMKKDCIKIADACINEDAAMYSRVKNVIEQLTKKLEPPKLAVPPLTQDNDDSDSAHEKKPGLLSALKGIFKSSSTSKLHSNGTSTHSTINTPKRPQ